MRLYEIDFGDHDLVHVVAGSANQAVEIFTTWKLARQCLPSSFTVAERPIGNLQPEQQEQVRRALAAGLVGVAHFDDELGWTFSPPAWQPLTDDDLASREGAA